MSFIPKLDLIRQFLTKVLAGMGSGTAIPVTLVDDDPSENKSEVSQPDATLLNATVTPAAGHGLASAANQTTGNNSLSSIDGKIPSKGQSNKAGSVPVTLASDQDAVPVSGTVAVTGVATAANQTTGNSSLSSLDGKLPAKGQAAMAASTPVVLASDQSTVPVSGSVTAAVTGSVSATPVYSGTPETLKSAGGVDNMGADFNSTAMDIRQAICCAIQIDVDSTTANGTLYIEGRISTGDYIPLAFDYGGTTVTSIAVAAANLDVLVNVFNAGYESIRVRYARTSGDGQCTIFGSKK